MGPRCCSPCRSAGGGVRRSLVCQVEPLTESAQARSALLADLVPGGSAVQLPDVSHAELLTWASKAEESKAQCTYSQAVQLARVRRVF